MKPILFNGDMVRKILDGEKTQTRRMNGYYHPGDILYVREAWSECAEGWAYKADFPDSDGWGWRPSIHMPKKAARIFLRVTRNRTQQVKDITAYEAYAEGFDSRKKFIASFLRMYPGCTEDSMVWVIEFERISKDDALIATLGP